MSNPTFKIWATLWWGYRYAFKNIRLIFRAGWIAMAVIFLLMILTPVLYALDIEIPINALMPLAFWASSYFAVPWHRAILMNENNPQVFRFRRPEFFYFLLVLVLSYSGDAGIYIFSYGLESIGISVDTPDQNSVWGNVMMVILSPGVLLFCILLACYISMILPAIAVGDHNMSPARAWRLWRGNRWRFAFFLLIGSALMAGIWTSVNAATSLVNGQIIEALEIDFQNLNSLEIDFIKFVFAFSAMVPLLVFILFYIVASTVGALSISYAGIVRHAIEVDENYSPLESIRDRVTV